MEKKKYLFVKDKNGKHRRLQIIEGDDVSREEILRQLNRDRVSHLEFQMERIRTDDTIDEMQKSSRRSELM